MRYLSVYLSDFEQTEMTGSSPMQLVWQLGKQYVHETGEEAGAKGS